jgi:hypothetical protein
MFRRKLVRELAVVLAIKLIALTVIYFLFFAVPARVYSPDQLAAIYNAGPQQR